MKYYYTLVWKDINNNDVVQFKSFLSVQALQNFIREYIKKYIKNDVKLQDLKPVDKERKIYYLDTKA